MREIDAIVYILNFYMPSILLLVVNLLPTTKDYSTSILKRLNKLLKQRKYLDVESQTLYVRLKFLLVC